MTDSTRTANSAREQAREAATYTSDWDAEDYDPHACADAASDVWEPLVRDLLEVIDMAVHQHTFIRQSDAYARAKGALGNGSSSE